MKALFFLPILIISLLASSPVWSCNRQTYAGCSPEQLRAIQQNQFQTRKYPVNNAHEYWRDRQYVDRVRLEERNHEIEIEKVRAETAIEVAKQERRRRYYSGHYYYRPNYRQPPPVRPVQPIADKPRVEPKEQINSKSSVKMISRGIK